MSAPRDHRLYRRRGKRALDLALAVPASLLLAPVAAVVALAVGATLGRPVLFHQTRPGLGARPFRMTKFRTMTEARSAEGKVRSDAERLTRLGRFLRRTSLDELPELWNVLRGEMSLVGPRPLLMEYLARYTPDEGRRHQMPPGITGWAQIHGRNTLDWEERLRLDVWYVDHVSPRLDLQILLATAGKVLRGEGIRAPGHATMPEFRGSTRE